MCSKSTCTYVLSAVKKYSRYVPSDTYISFVQVEVNETNYTFNSSEQMRVSLLVNQLRVNFTKGERFPLSAFAVNSVGTSDPVSVDIIVPCELCEYTWNIQCYSS